MKSATIEYADGNQKLIGQVFFPEEHAKHRPAIILFHAFEGRGKFTLNYAERLAQHGFITFAADMYGDAVVATTLDECFKLIAPFLQDRELTRRRAVLAYQAVQKISQVDVNHIGAAGFCFGGMCALEVARSGENLQATVSMHGVLTKSKLATHPIKSKILILHGYKDPQVPPEVLQPFAQEMEAACVKDWTFTFFGDAQHSFTDPVTGTFDAVKEKEMGRQYNPIAAQRAFRYTLDFFQEILQR